MSDRPTALSPQVEPSKPLRDRVTRFLRAMQAHRANPGPHSHRIFHESAHVISFCEEEFDAYRHLVDLLLREFGQVGAVSARTVESRLDEAIFLARAPLTLTGQDRALLAASELFERLGRAICPWQAHFQVDGLNDQCLPFAFGRATFFPRGTSLWPMIEPKGAAEGESLHAFRVYVKQNIEEHFGGSGQWVQMNVSALEHDSAAAMELGLSELKLTLDALNFYADVFRPSAYKARVALADKAAKGLRKSCANMHGKEPGGVGTAVTRPLDNVWLPAMESEEARETGLPRVARILATPHASRSAVEHRVLGAVRWAGRASVADEFSDQLILYMMALEALVNDDSKRSGIAVTVETRAAQLVNNDNSVALRDVHLQKLYELRSRLVHSGWASVSSADIWNARCWAKHATLRVLTGPLIDVTDDEYNSWFCAPPADRAG